MTSPYLLRPLRTLAEVSRQTPANRSEGKTPVSTPNLHDFLHSFIARYPATSEERAKSDASKRKQSRGKPALVWTNDAPPVRTRRRDWKRPED